MTRKPVYVSRVIALRGPLLGLCKGCGEPVGEYQQRWPCEPLTAPIQEELWHWTCHEYPKNGPFKGD